MEAVKLELTEILLALVTGLKVIVKYLIPSIVISIILIPNIATIIQEKPEMLLPSIINAVILALVTYFSPKVVKLQEKVVTVEETSEIGDKP